MASAIFRHVVLVASIVTSILALQACEKRPELSDDVKKKLDAILLQVSDINKANPQSKQMERAAEAVKNNDTKAKDEIAAETKKQIEQVAPSIPPAPQDAKTPSCDEIIAASKNATGSAKSLPAEITPALIDKCKQDLQNPPKDDSDKQRRRDIALLLRLLAILSMAYGNPELASYLWAAAAAVEASAQDGGGGGSQSTTQSGQDNQNAPPIEYKGDVDPDTKKTIQTRGANNFLQGTGVGSFLAMLPEGSDKVTFVDGKTNKDILELPLNVVRDWTDPSKRPKRTIAAIVRPRPDGTLEMQSYTYEAQDGKRYTATWAAGSKEPTITEAKP